MTSKKEINQANWLLQEMMFTASKSNRAVSKQDADEFNAQYMTLLAYVNVMRAYHRVSVRVITDITDGDFCTVKAFRIDGTDIKGVMRCTMKQEKGLICGGIKPTTIRSRLPHPRASMQG